MCCGYGINWGTLVDGTDAEAKAEALDPRQEGDFPVTFVNNQLSKLVKKRYEWRAYRPCQERQSLELFIQYKK